jgi:hypothetical protein
LDEAEKREIMALTRKHGAPQAMAERACIVLAAADGLMNKEIANRIGVSIALPSDAWPRRSIPPLHSASHLAGVQAAPPPCRDLKLSSVPLFVEEVREFVGLHLSSP